MLLTKLFVYSSIRFKSKTHMGKIKIKDDIHYSSCYGLVTRSEALKYGYEVELIPHIEKGTYTFTKYGEDGIILIHFDEDFSREFELDFESDWLEFV